MVNTYELLLEAGTEAELVAVRDTLLRSGYSGFYKFLESMKAKIKGFGDGEQGEVLALIAKAREAVPNPGEISPSWTYIWDLLEKMTQYKLKVLQTVPVTEREGEWQVLIDNPFQNREVACYPGLTFEAAAYIYAQFRPELEHNEYIRLQKIQTHITEFGE